MKCEHCGNRKVFTHKDGKIFCAYCIIEVKDDRIGDKN